LYNSEARTEKLFYCFALLGIVLASLGLFGLITFTSKQRTKEIGIRKVLGATVASIIILLSNDLLKLVAIAIVIALPLTWWYMDQWLGNFAYHTDLSWQVFAMAGGISIAIASLILSLQAMKASTANPVDSLRND
jgi:putative ABC transport system permease protein